MRELTSAPRWIGVICLGVGLFILGIAFGVVPTDPETVHVPPWVLAACGLVFALCGVAVMTPEHSPIRAAAGATVVLAMGLVGAWVSLWGDAEGFSGGVPFLSPEANVVVARVVFGFGALTCFAIFAWGASRLARGAEEQPEA